MTESKKLRFSKLPILKKFQGLVLGLIGFTVKKIGHGLEHVKTNLRFFGLSLNFYSNF